MKTDNYFEIGSSHEVCQDYALSGQINDNISYAIVSDGCTMSHKACGQVDLGARILAHSAKDVIKRIWCKSKSVEETGFESVDELNVYLRERAIIMTRMVEKQLDLPDLFADCTLLIAVADKTGKAITFAYGDGSVYVKKRCGTEHVVDVSFTSGAPLYLSYQTDPARKRAYMDEFGAMPVFVEEYEISDIELAKKKEMGYYGSTLVYAKDPKIYERAIKVWDNIEIVSVTSDGAKSFLRPTSDGFTPVAYLDIMGEFHAFKNKNGVFVQRRMKAMSKNYKKEEITHYDDISVAAIITE